MKGPYPFHTGLAMQSALLRRISSKVTHLISRPQSPENFVRNVGAEQ